MTRSLAPVLRRLWPWVIGWVVFHLVAAAVGRFAARRENAGDESSTRIRRVLTHNSLVLAPQNPALEQVRVDMAMAGAEIDLTGIPRPAQGVDLTLRVLMGGAAVRVPPDWQVWWRTRGVGGVGGDDAVRRTHDETTADLRIHAVVVFGGVGVETG